MYHTSLLFKTKTQTRLSQSRSAFHVKANRWLPTWALLVTAQVSSQEGLTYRSSLEQSFLGRPRGLPGPLLCKTCEEKHWVWDSKRSKQMSSSWKQPLCPQLSMLLSLTQSNQCADYCTTALSWTGSLNTGATEQDLQKLPTMHLKILSRSWEKPLPAQGCSLASPWILLPRLRLKGCDFQSWRGTFAADWGTGNEFRTRKRGRAGLESPYMGWCHPGEVWACASRWRDRWNRPALRHGSVHKMVPDVLV